MAGVTAKCNSDCESCTSEGTNDESLCRDNSTTSSYVETTIVDAGSCRCSGGSSSHGSNVSNIDCSNNGKPLNVL